MQNDVRNFNEELQEVGENVNEQYAAAQVSDEVFTIIAKNATTGTKTQIDVFYDNTLGQVYDSVVSLIKIKKTNTEPVFFVNESNQFSSADKGATMQDMELQSGDVLSIYPDGQVAAN